MNIHKLGSRGFTHHMVLAAIVLIVAIGGTAYLVASHADSCNPAQSGVSGTSSTSGTSDPNCQPTSGTSAPVSQPTDSRAYKTLIYQANLGKVYACLDSSNAVYMRVVTNSATKLAYWFDANKATNLNVPVHSTVYRHVAVAGTNFAVRLATSGVGQGAAATRAVASLNACN